MESMVAILVRRIRHTETNMYHVYILLNIVLWVESKRDKSWFRPVPLGPDAETEYRISRRSMLNE